MPDNFDDLVAFPGVGPKMANLVLQCSFGINVGISVDTHVFRISNILKWVRKPTKTPTETGKALEEWVPKDKYREINFMLAGFGQTICKPVAPRCWECPIAKLCPKKSKNLKPSESSK